MDAKTFDLALYKKIDSQILTKIKQELQIENNEELVNLYDKISKFKEVIENKLKH